MNCTITTDIQQSNDSDALYYESYYKTPMFVFKMLNRAYEMGIYSDVVHDNLLKDFREVGRRREYPTLVEIEDPINEYREISIQCTEEVIQDVLRTCWLHDIGFEKLEENKNWAMCIVRVNRKLRKYGFFTRIIESLGEFETVLP